MRLDKFLKVSRILKRRSVAANFASANKVTVNGNIAKPAKQLKIGDKVTIALGAHSLTFIVKILNEKVTKEFSDTLYEIISE